MPIVDFDIEAAKAIAVLDKLAQSIGAGNLQLNNMAINFTKLNNVTGVTETSISGITRKGQQLTATMKEEAGAIELVTLKLNEQSKAAQTAAAAATAAADRRRDARLARSRIEGTLNLAGMDQSQIDSIRSRISQITSAIEKGKAKLSDFLRAAIVQGGGNIGGTLNEEGQKILTILSRIQNAQDQATRRAREAFTAQQQRGANEQFGAQFIQRFTRRTLDQAAGLDTSAIERIRNQMERIQGLFSRGLDQAQFRNAFNAFRSGAIVNLTEVEREVRHRLTRIRAEVERAPQGGFFQRLLFGDQQGGGGGALGGGGATNLVAGLLLSRGVIQARDSIKENLKEVADYQKQIALLQTLTQDNKASFDAWSQSILRVSNAVGKSREEIASAGYDLLSNQVTKGVADTETALTRAAKFAVVTNSTTTDAVNLLSSVINSFGFSVENTDTILSKLFTTIDLGRIKASDMANSFGRPGVAAKALGVSFDELSAAQITISQTGIGAEQTNTLITNVFHKLLNPTKELQELYDKLGVSTGEMFVKTYGFTGVLKILEKETGGSSAALSKFFNEIRGEQGITQLITRMRVFEDALKKLGAGDTLAGAEKIFKNLQGQRFAQEMEKVSNTFLKFQDISLKALFYVTDATGGLAKSIEYASYTTFGLGAAMAGLYGFSRFAAITADVEILGAAVAATRTQLLALSPILIGGFGLGVAIGGIASNLYELYEETENFATEAQRIANETTKTVTDSMAKMNDAALTKNAATLNSMQQKALSYVSQVKAALSTVAEKEKETFSKVAEELKNSFELVAQATKKAIADGEAIEKRAIDNIENHRERRNTARLRFQDELYERQLKANDLNVKQGEPDREGALQLRRIRDLVAQSGTLAGSKDPKDADRAIALMEKAQALAQQRALATREVDTGFGSAEVLKYSDGFRVANSLAVAHSQLLNKIRSTNQAIVDQQRVANEKERERLKIIQDKAEAVTGFKLYDNAGKFLFKSIDEARTAREKAITEYQATIKGQIPIGTILEHGKTLEEVRAKSEAQLGRFREASEAQLGTEVNKRTAEAKGEEVTKTFAEQQNRLKALKAQQDEATKQYVASQQSAFASIDTLQARSQFSFMEKLYTPMSPERAAMDRVPKGVVDSLGLAESAAKADDLVTALAKVDEAREKLKKVGGGDASITGKGGETTTVTTMIDALKAELIVAKDAQDSVKAIGVQTDNVVVKNQNLLATLGGYAAKYTELQTASQGFSDSSVAAFKTINTEATNLLTSMGSMIAVMEKMTSTAASLAAIQAQISKGIVPASDFKTMPLELNPGKASGGMISGSDRHLTPTADGEFVANQRATGRFLPQLIAMNAGFEPSFSSGKGGGNSYNIGDIHITLKGGESSTTSAREMANEIKRQIRRGTIEL